MSPVPAWKEAGRADQAMLFLHGIGGNRTIFDDQLSAFAADWRAVAWDMPGYGDSAPLPRMTWPALADSLLRLFDELALADAVVVGHSMGGMVAQAFVARYPDRVRALVRSATSPAFGKPGGEWQRQFLSERLAPLERGLTPADLADQVMAGMFAADAAPEARRRAVAAMARIPSEIYRAALKCLVTFDGREDLAGIACPALLLAGERDEIAPPRVMQRMAEKVAGALYQCLTGTGHLGNLERPELFNAAIREFLDSLTL